MKHVIKTLFPFLLVAITCNVIAQSKEELAQAMYQKAESAYEGHQYTDCTKYLNQTMDLLNKVNPKILYLMAKSQYESIKTGAFPASIENYKTVAVKVDDFFKMVNKSTYPPEKYSEMLELKVEVKEKIDAYEKRKSIYTNLKSREAAFIKDTIDVFAAAFCKDFNEAFLKQPIKPLEDHMWGMNLDCPVKLEYDPFQHTIKVFDSKNLKNWHIVHLLTHITLQDNLGTIYFYTDKELEKNYTEVNAKAADTYTGDPEANKWQWQHAINFEHKSKAIKNWDYDFSSSITKIKELAAIMDRTGFSDYYNDKFTDIEN